MEPNSTKPPVNSNIPVDQYEKGNDNDNGGVGVLISQDMILPAAIKPRHLAKTETLTEGSLYYVDENGNFTPLVPGTSGQIITTDGTTPSWGTIYGDGWNSISATLTYSSADDPTYIVSTSSDLTGSIGVGMRIKFTNNSTTFYGIVTAIDASTITLYGGSDYDVANSAITNPSFSFQKVPFGFPISPAKWSETFSDTSDRTQATPTSGTWYNVGTSTLSIPIGVWRVYYECVAAFTNSAGGDTLIRTGLSTANNSQGDAELSAAVFTGGADQRGLYSIIHREKTLALASKTSYYLNLMTTSGNRTSLDLYGSTFGTTIIKAICAYL